VLMFGDAQWQDEREQGQAARQLDWLSRARRPVVIEIGAGTQVPSVRWFTHSLVQRCGARLVRINLREAEVVPEPGVGLPLSAAAALKAIDEALGRSDDGLGAPRAA
jgi:hypothetical protein